MAFRIACRHAEHRHPDVTFPTWDEMASAYLDMLRRDEVQLRTCFIQGDPPEQPLPS